MSIQKAPEIPRCPFCTQEIPRPRQVEPKHLGDFDYGVCECGAVFVHDITGHNLGAAMVEALAFACDDDWDLAWELMPEEDYVDALIEGYDISRHKVFPKGYDQEGNKIKGALSFIRLKDDIRDIKSDGVKKRFALSMEKPDRLATKGEVTLRTTKSHGKRYSKRQVEKLVRSNDIKALTQMAFEDPLVLRKIQRLLYTADMVKRWQAVVVLGAVASGISHHNPTAVGDLLRRLLYSANDSAAANWGAIETVGEIIRNQPSLYGSFVRHILGLIGDVPSRPAILWAIGRIGELHPRLVRTSSFFVLFDLLDAKEPEIRGHAAWALGQLGAKEAYNAVKRLIEDKEEFYLFDGDELKYTTVAHVARKALKNMSELEKGKMEIQKNEAKKPHSQEPKEIIKARQIYQEAEILKNRGQSLDALAKFEEILAVFDSHGYEVEVANVCEKIGDLHVMRGNMKAALSPYKRTLAICEKKNDPISTVIMLEKVIDIYRHLKEYEKCLPYYMRALELVENLSDVKRSALFLTGIGDIYERKGQLEDALDAYSLAEKLFRNMGAREKADLLKSGIEQIEARLKANS